ncbi:hydroxyacylglutathione hydrolase [Simiduia aestuariiviva]|uniref:Hydroxyacylglutathione hydrolase n=1 Tax=Simiduia aestuariiviva TaxID=1510459 RepID=A0A839ULR0_9GAMM|nr:hydroxyacylglutathione hydrolase [Simiduia aestuariiviva]MBB3168613.1 hydroxyacylglutathione hydrolase [Simiduia aestuariiviva]
MLDLTPIPAFTDNYIWALSDGRHCWVVDPGDAEPVEQWLAARGLPLTGILITHHHADHIGGVDALQRNRANLPIYGPQTPKIPQVTQVVSPAAPVSIGPWQLEVLNVPAHTLDHIAYFLPADTEQPGALFCGDTLFAAGCGRLFEGTADQLHQALAQFKALPPATLICCAHEYTLANLAFAKAVEPENPNIDIRITQEQCKRAAGLPTLPSTLALELDTNPFLRTQSPDVIANVSAHSNQSLDEPIATMGALRRWKDNF